MTNGLPSRGHYRIQYPLAERPICVTNNGEEFSVVNVSEAGLNLLSDTADVLVGDRFRANLVFRSGTAVAVAGKVLRRTKTRVVILLDQGVPLPIIMEEQRWLIQKYSTLELAEVGRREAANGLKKSS